MRNIPLFTTEYGIASLTLEKIPYTAQAYITVQDATDLENLLRACADFCTCAGAEHIYATHTKDVERYPLYTEIISMTIPSSDLSQTGSVAVCASKENFSEWREIYNEKMRNVPNAAFMTIRDGERYLQAGKCYFVYRDDVVIGIGSVGNGTIESIASVVSGGGKDTLLALGRRLVTEEISLEVARNNLPAIKLYNSIGFKEKAVISRWYKIK